MNVDEPYTREDGRGCDPGFDGFPLVLVEPSDLLRTALANMLSSIGFKVVHAIPCFREHVLDSCAQHQLLLLLALGGEVDEVPPEVYRARQRAPQMKLVLLADCYTVGGLTNAFSVGADACLTKSMAWETVHKSLDLVLLGQSVAPSQLMRSIVWGRDSNPTGAALVQGRAAGPRLSARELTVLGLLTEGASNKVIARAASIAEATVKVHVKAILRKIGAQNRTQAAMWAMNHRTPITMPSKVESTEQDNDPSGVRRPLGSVATGQV
jgi:two-component system, NarL family, nitrate/nitrite response regulator NarL